MIDFVQLLSKALTEITVFQSENVAYKKEFVFRKEPLRENLLRQGRTVYGHLIHKRERGGTLQISGFISNHEEERSVQIAIFSEWHKGSVQITGKLDVSERELTT